WENSFTILPTRAGNAVGPVPWRGSTTPWSTHGGTAAHEHIHLHRRRPLAGGAVATAVPPALSQAAKPGADPGGSRGCHDVRGSAGQRGSRCRRRPRRQAVAAAEAPARRYLGGISARLRHRSRSTAGPGKSHPAGGRRRDVAPHARLLRLG